MLNRMKHTSGILLLMWMIAFPFVATAATFSIGTETSYNDTSTSFPGAAKLDDTHVLIAFPDDDVGKAVIATIDGTTLTFGSEYEFCASSCGSINVAMLDSTHAIIIYQTSGNGYGVVATISGSTISYGTPVNFASSIRTGNQVMSVTALDSTHVAVMYVTQAGTYSTKVIAATISGNSVSFGSATTLSANSGQYVAIAAMDSTHFIAAYNLNNGTPYIVAASVSGNTMTFGSGVTFSDYCCDPSISKLTSGRAVIAFRSDSTDNPTALVATLSDTSLSAGSGYSLASVSAYYPYAAPLSATKLVLMFRNNSDDFTMHAVEVTVSGSTLTGGASVSALSEIIGNLSRIAVPLDSTSALLLANNKAVIVTTDTTAPSRPSSFTLTGSGASSLLAWTNPVDADFASITVRRSASSYPTTYTGGTAVTSNVTGTSYTNSGLSDGTYYYSIFARDLRGNYSRASTGSVAIDSTPPAFPRNFLPSTQSGNVMLSWTNPTDSDFASVTIRRSTSRVPTSATDGTAVTTGNTGTSHTDSSVPNGTHYYAIFAKDTSGNYSTAAHAIITVSSSTTNSGGSGGGSGGGRSGGAARSTSHSAAASTPHTPSTSNTVDSPTAASTPKTESNTPVSAPVARMLEGLKTRLESRVQQQIAAKPSLAPILNKMLTRMNARIARQAKRSASR